MSLLDPFNSIITDFTGHTLKIVNFGMKGCVKCFESVLLKYKW